ncbi:Glyoxalase/Bleomycin resistance protein/Dihydroxybiphenyl dioxygenase [Syncephalis plumigaleata]|nr:Glyoxalase/Bleomycin resistance protein/Dihydroxybiphenyl dioxygenase [Syncephalis plumigaleata]
MTVAFTEGNETGGDRFLSFDHITFWVGNAKQAASYYTTRFGFKQAAYRSLETGHRNVCSYVVKQNDITFVFQAPLTPNKKDMVEHHAIHGDGVKDVAFTVEDARAAWTYAVNRGAKSIREPWTETDADGTVVMATIAAFGDVEHTFVERKNYHGIFLPNYSTPRYNDRLESTLPPVRLLTIDHVVGSQPEGELEPVCDFYEKTLGFHRFWSVDDTQFDPQYSSMRSTVMASYDEKVKMTINEPAQGKKRSQIQEYVDYYGGSGAQHIALVTDNIVDDISAMRDRGAEFLAIPDTYYDNLRYRLKSSSVKITESIEELQRLGILVDYDENGYLLQLFTIPVEDRPTLFLEVIQRRNHQGFGAGNFRALFEAVEREQNIRGNLE